MIYLANLIYHASSPTVNDYSRVGIIVNTTYEVIVKTWLV